MEFELDKALRFIPGQFAKLRVAPFEWRDYSIAATNGKRLTLLISNRTHGDGSNYADAVQPGEATEIEAPLGHYHLMGNSHRKVFVATGTGLVPFLPMFEQLAQSGGRGEIVAASLRGRRSHVPASRDAKMGGAIATTPCAGGAAPRLDAAELYFGCGVRRGEHRALLLPSRTVVCVSRAEPVKHAAVFDVLERR